MTLFFKKIIKVIASIIRRRLGVLPVIMWIIKLSLLKKALAGL